MDPSAGQTDDTFINSPVSGDPSSNLISTSTENDSPPSIKSLHRQISNASLSSEEIPFQFILKFYNGVTFRFSSPSARETKEWVSRLNDLSLYWRLRSLRDFDFRAQAVAKYAIKIESGCDESSIEPNDQLWNWCLFAGCNKIRVGYVHLLSHLEF